MRIGRTLSGRALRTSLIVFTLGSFVPAWEVTHFGAICTVGESTNLWRAIAAVPDCLRNIGTEAHFWHFQERNVVASIALFVFSIGVGLGAYWRSKGQILPIEAADYKDAPNGAAPDGRVGPLP